MLAMSLQCRATFYSYVNRHSEAIADFMELVKLAKDMHGKDSLEVRGDFARLKLMSTITFLEGGQPVARLHILAGC